MMEISNIFGWNLLLLFNQKSFGFPLFWIILFLPLVRLPMIYPVSQLERRLQRVVGTPWRPNISILGLHLFIVLLPSRLEVRLLVN
jgi:hypothetical protein